MKKKISRSRVAVCRCFVKNGNVLMVLVWRWKLVVRRTYATISCTSLSQQDCHHCHHRLNRLSPQTVTADFTTNRPPTDCHHGLSPQTITTECHCHHSCHHRLHHVPQNVTTDCPTDCHLSSCGYLKTMTLCCQQKLKPTCKSFLR